MAKLSHKYGGTYTTKGAYLFVAPAPLDTRSVVETIDHLISEDVWKNPDYTAFNGLQVYVESTQELYILKNSSGLKSNLQPQSYFTGTTNQNGEVITPPATSDNIQAKVDLYWEKLASAADVSSLSGVFKFKGVAESINEAQTIITLSSATATKGSNTYTVKCQTIGYEYDMDIYYGWGTTADSILFWTDTPTLTSTSTLYGVTTPTAVKKLVLNGEDYYIADRTVPAGDGLSQWENISGKVVYCNETTSKVYSEDLEDPEYELGVAEIVTYEAYDFAPLVASDKYTVSNIASADVAAGGNAGHVYQIGENEYASNGQIWVKLGSPVEDWIIL